MRFFVLDAAVAATVAAGADDGSDSMATDMLTSKNNCGDTPLMVAAAQGHEDIVHFLAAHMRFPPPLQQPDQQRRQQYRQQRCGLDTRNRVGVTAIMHATIAGHDGVVNVHLPFRFSLPPSPLLLLMLGQILLDMGADPEVADVLGNTALHYSTAYGHLNVIRTLILYCGGGGMVDAPNRLGWKPVSHSCTLGVERYFLRLVAECGLLRAQAAVAAAADNAPVRTRPSEREALPHEKVSGRSPPPALLGARGSRGLPPEEVVDKRGYP